MSIATHWLLACSNTSQCPEIMQFSRPIDLAVWTATRALARDLYAITAHAPFADDTSLRDRVRHSALSAMSAAADAALPAFGNDCDPRSALRDLDMLVRIAADLGYLAGNDFDRLLDRIQRALSLTGAARGRGPALGEKLVRYYV